MNTHSSELREAPYRTFMTAFFAGLISTVICLIYNVAYRSTRPYFSSTLLNVSYIIYGMIFLFTLIGLIYLFIRRIGRSSDLIFFLLFVALTIIAVTSIRSAVFSADPVENSSLHSEYTGVTIISGVLAAVGIPLLHRSRKFERYVV